MRIGMIFECSRDGADIRVCEYLAKRFLPDIEIESIPLDNKPKLIANCGEVASILLQNCDRVLIIWDLNPPWGAEKLCRKKDCDKIKQSLNDAGLTTQQLQRVHLVCIEQELEAWLLADSRALSSFLQKVTNRQCNVANTHRPEQVPNPKKRLNQIMQEYTGRRYEDREHAEKIIKELPDFRRIRHCRAFVRFRTKVMGNTGFDK